MEEIRKSSVTAESVVRYSIRSMEQGRLYSLPQADARVMWAVSRLLPEKYRTLVTYLFKSVQQAQVAVRPRRGSGHPRRRQIVTGAGRERGRGVLAAVRRPSTASQKRADHDLETAVLRKDRVVRRRRGRRGRARDTAVKQCSSRRHRYQ
jgi:hypothetical protein